MPVSHSTWAKSGPPVLATASGPVAGGLALLEPAGALPVGAVFPAKQLRAPPPLITIWPKSALDGFPK